MLPLDVWRLGRVEYADGLALMDQFQAARREGAVPDSLLLLEHPAVLTMGRGAKALNVLATPVMLESLGIERFETDRGGDVTYHGPGQLVGYPMLFLPPGKQDVRRYVRNLEETIIRTLADFGLAAARMPQWPGVWVEKSRAGGPRKICALGVHLSRWYTRHGFALNIEPSLGHFELIVPCGIREAGVTSMAVELGQAPSMTDVSARVAHHFAQVFELEPREATPALTSVAVALRHDAKVLVLRRVEAKGGFWQVVTGLVEAGEQPADAARRELEEETGVIADVRPVSVPHAFAMSPRDGAPTVCVEHIFVADAVSPQVRLSAEHDSLTWASLSLAIERMPHPGLRLAVRAALVEGRQEVAEVDGH